MAEGTTHRNGPDIWTAMETPSAARMYDYLLGGSHNFPADREAAERVLAANPDAALLSRVNRAFLRRAVGFLLEEGIDQFLDIGSGIPTAGNVHEIALAANPSARIVYVDIDPVAVQHSLIILRDTPTAAAVQADARQPERILDHSEVRRLLDFRRPVGLLLVAVLHFITDDEEVHRSVATLRDALAPGSYLVLTHGTPEGGDKEIMERTERTLIAASTPTRSRSLADIARFFDGLELVAPGLVPAPLWRPESPNDLFLDCPERCNLLAGAGRKPGGEKGCHSAALPGVL